MGIACVGSHDVAQPLIHLSATERLASVEAREDTRPPECRRLSGSSVVRVTDSWSIYEKNTHVCAVWASCQSNGCNMSLRSEHGTPAWIN